MRVSEQNITEVFGNLRNDFRMAKQTRFTPRMTGVSTSGSAASYHYNQSSLIHMIERARFYERNDMVVGQGVRRLVSNVIQGGFTPDPQTTDDELDTIFKDLWREWANDPDQCHSEGELTFHQIEKLTLRSTIRDGDMWHLLLGEGSMQPVEAHGPRSPYRTKRRVTNGILVDDSNVRKEVWISKENYSATYPVKYSEIERYAIRDELGHRVVLQVYFPDRFSQHRGISAFAPCSDTIGMHDDLQFTTLVKAQLASLLVILREQNGDAVTGNNEGPPIGGDLTAPSTIYDPAGSVDKISGIQAGVDYLAPQGQTVKGFSPNIPNPTFFEHSMLLLTFISVNLDLPVQMLLLDPQKSNFSSWRGAIDQARIRFREMQKDLVQQLHRPTYQWKIRQWASKSRALRKMIANNPKWMEHVWKIPSFAYIEPNKDALADATQSHNFLSSFRRIMSNRGNEWDEICTEIVADRGQLIRKAMELEVALKGEFNDVDVTWRDILSPLMGATSTSSVSRSIIEDSLEQ